MHLLPSAGTLAARIFENQRIGLEPTVFFDIEIPIVPFVFEGETQKTSLCLGFIELEVSDWHEIWDRRFEFPMNPEPGYIDGSLYLDHVHNPADAPLIEFGRPTDEVVPVNLEAIVDFEYEGPRELGKVRLRWTTTLSFDARNFDHVFGEARSRGIF